MKLKRYGPDYLLSKHHSLIRSTFRLFGATALTGSEEQHDSAHTQAMKVMKAFFDYYQWKLMSIKMLAKTKRLFELVFYMQVKIQRNRITISAMTDILINYWDKMNIELLQNAIKNQDGGMKHLLLQIQNSPMDVRRQLLDAYVLQCRKIHSLSFMQWRIYFSHGRKNNTQVGVNDSHMIATIR